ncbi:hypothetical protein ACFXGI_06840 [Streptomyces sp. NPDC059355]|uniref:hypothetical protein n=1 Tax=Streptomyces sp. NPDC059355 TaxID=3346811 RepID=UPI0036A469A9
MAPAHYGHHSEAEARVMQQTISILDADGKGDTIASDSFATGQGANGSVAHEHAKGEARQSCITGREDADSALRTRK